MNKWGDEVIIPTNIVNKTYIFEIHQIEDAEHWWGVLLSESRFSMLVIVLLTNKTTVDRCEYTIYSEIWT